MNSFGTVTLSLNSVICVSSQSIRVESIFRNRDALISLSRIRRFDEYTFRHSINVAVLSLNLAVSLGIVDSELTRLGIGAVLHDMGKVRLPDGLVQKKGGYDQQEYEILRRALSEANQPQSEDD